MSDLGDRIKRYEKTFHHTALHRSPLMIRVDGRAFHTFTRKLKRPFDTELMAAMVSSACQIAKDMQGFKAGYVQSDEVTFCLTDYDTVETQGWFDYDLSKIVSISAAMMSVAFNANYPSQRRPVFDSRAFSLPIYDVVNAFLWRAKDWERNSLQMYARSFFSDKELHGKARIDMHEMLHGIGKNWTIDLTPQERNGTFLILNNGNIEQRTDIVPTYLNIKEAIGGLFDLGL